MLKLGFVRSRQDDCLYTRIQDGDEVYVVLYEDDLLVCGRKLETITKLKKQLATIFATTGWEEVTQFMGMSLDTISD